MKDLFVRLANRIRVAEVCGKIYLLDDEINELEGGTPESLPALRLLEAGCSRQAIDEILGPTMATQLLHSLEDADLLRTEKFPKLPRQVYAKQLYYLDDFTRAPALAQRRLVKARVAILGVGGIGCIVLQHLVAAGLRSFVLLDADEVQLENLNRQYVFNRGQVGVPKTTAAVEYLRGINRQVRVTAHQVFLSSPKDLDVLNLCSIDLLVNAADQPSDLELSINEYCIRKRIPWITCAVGRHVGTWGPLVVPGVTPCMACFLRREEDQMNPVEKAVRSTMNERIEASFGPTNSIIGSLLAKDVILYLARVNAVPSLGTRCAFDFESLCGHKSIASGTEPCACWTGS